MRRAGDNPAPDTARRGPRAPGAPLAVQVAALVAAAQACSTVLLSGLTTWWWWSARARETCAAGPSPACSRTQRVTSPRSRRPRQRTRLWTRLWTRLQRGRALLRRATARDQRGAMRNDGPGASTGMPTAMPMAIPTAMTTATQAARKGQGEGGPKPPRPRSRGARRSSRQQPRARCSPAAATQGRPPAPRRFLDRPSCTRTPKRSNVSPRARSTLWWFKMARLRVSRMRSQTPGGTGATSLYKSF